MFEVIEQELESFSHLWHLGCLAMAIIIIIIIIIIIYYRM